MWFQLKTCQLIFAITCTDSWDVEEFINCGPWRNTQISYEVVTLMVEKAITTGTWFTELLESNSTYDVVLTEFPLNAEPLAYLAHRLDHPILTKTNLVRINKFIL